MLSTAFLLPVHDGQGRPAGQRFCVYHAARSKPRGALVYVHPFAEEMNKSRRMAALQSRRLAEAGYAVLQIDLQGCGDSSDDLADASWAGWVADVIAAAHWLQARLPGITLWFWGLRMGCLLAAEAAARLGGASRLLFWQPATSGRQLLAQFLRLKQAADLLAGPAAAGGESLKDALAAGRSVEVAGYRLPTAITTGLQQAALQPVAACRRLEWLEVSSRVEPSLSPASTTTLAAWRDAGVAARIQCVHGPAFWQTTEIEEAPALLDATLTALAEPQRA